MPGLGLGEPLVNAPRGHFTDIRHLGQLFQTGFHKRFQAAEIGCQTFSGFGPHLPDAQGEDQPGNVLLLAGFNGAEQLLGGFRAGLPEPRKRIQRQIVDIRRGVNGPFFNKAVHNGAAQPLNVHGVPADKVGDVPAQLGGALRAGAAQESPVLVPFHGRAADRAFFRQKIGLRPLRPFGEVHFQNFRDDLPGLADAHRVPHPDIQPGDKVLIVQCGVGDGGSRQTHGSDHGLGRQHARAAHLHHNVLHKGFLLLRRVFVGHSPPGKFGGGPQRLPGGQIIQLDDGAVYIARKFFPLLVDTGDLSVNFSSVGKAFVGNDLEAQGFEILQGLCMASEGLPLRQLDIEHQNIQLPFGGHLGILLPQGACRGVSGVGKGLLPVFLQGIIQSVEGLLGHEYLSPDNEPGRGTLQGHGNGADGLQVFRHILAYNAVSPGGPSYKLPIFIFQGHGQAIDFRFHGEGRAGHGFLGTGQKIVQLFRAEHILQAHKRHRVGHLAEGIHRLTAHPFCGRIRQGQLRIGLFQILQLPQQVVVFKVGHSGVVQHIVPVARFV